MAHSGSGKKQKWRRKIQGFFNGDLLAIIEKYKQHPCCIVRNKLLPFAITKKVAKEARIDKHLTAHTARHTFATTILMNNGCPIESVKEMLGHESIVSTQIYTKITDVKVKKNMKLIQDKITTKLSEAKLTETGS